MTKLLENKTVHFNFAQCTRGLFSLFDVFFINIIESGVKLTKLKNTWRMCDV